MSLPSFQQRLASFREQLKAQNIACFIQSTADAHQSEYVCNRDKRMGFLSGFTGSAGTIVVTPTDAKLWTDGRYFLAANKQLSNEWSLMKQGLPDTPSVEKWIKDNVDGKVGIDPFLCSLSYYNRIKDALEGSKAELVLVEQNPIDGVWSAQQPPIPSSKVFVHELQYSGQSMQEKIKNVQQKINEFDVQALIVTKLDHIAWLLNLRGNDIVYNPVFFSYLIVTRTDIFLYIDPSKVDANNEEEKQVNNDIKQHLNGIQIVPYENFLTDLKRLVSEYKTGKFWYDPRQTNMAIYSAIPKEQRFEKDDCIEIMKAIKNETEVQGFLNCHVRDGAAKSRFFAWVQSLRDGGQSELEKHTEWSFAEKLLSLRREAELFVDLSFETISSIGANGAVIHYSPSESEHSAIKANEVYLLDSGGQYLDGTTDTTRTYWLGVNGATPSEYQRECYTRVLKGVIALTKIVFPSNTKGPMIDSVARSYLWQIGLDYRHGTGHGVGCFLNVHEGPHGFSASTFRRTLFEYGLKTNMVITNEPGYYEADKFGIRIENVMIVKPVKTKYAFDNLQFCSFTTATMVPIDKELLDMSIMNDEEFEWLNSYHKEVYGNILPFMQTQFEKDW
eukprot:CAMPEP_0202697452 /NCGR_PEP_ID=MMETSP1385-20130828/10782_1 /ASSEMBLY_ACC=CAM_ASM_000861 /TAXON_ID=933848 /ORGANISM="Elphidium margaritaceum" /LENGTH=614 /DNA_ID=CAMNT_0049353915 /DNA_START=164 /DNA_END=2005 /DNA_ORIENTATION=+